LAEFESQDFAQFCDLALYEVHGLSSSRVFIALIDKQVNVISPEDDCFKKIKLKLPIDLRLEMVSGKFDDFLPPFLLDVVDHSMGKL